MVDLVRPPTLGVAVADRIRDSIIRGAIALGSPLREVELATSFGVSTGPVREAVRLLVGEGIVEVIPHRGAFVTRLSAKEAEETYTMRQLLEPYAVSRAIKANAYTGERMSALEALLVRLDECERRGEEYEIVRTDTQFHYALCEPCNHSLVLGMLQNLQTKTILFLLNASLYIGQQYTSQAAAHRAILDAVRSGGGDYAADVLRQHLEDKVSLLLARLAEQAGEETTDPR
jgi:DNA-binding GntR family transcriptional regulator